MICCHVFYQQRRCLMAAADIRLRRGEQRIFVRTTPTEMDLITQIPGATWDKSSEGWWLPLTWAACLQLRGVFAARLELSTSIQEWAWEQRRHTISHLLTLREELRIPP